MKRITLIIAMLGLFVVGAQAQMVGVNTGSYGTSNNYGDRPRGHYLKVEAGYPNFITLAYGYQITPGFFMGAGGGFGMMNYDYKYDSYYSSGQYVIDGLGLPFFAELTFSTRRKSVAFFVDYKIGANISLNDNYYSWIDTYYSYGYSYSYYAYNQRRGKVFYSALNFGAYFGNFGVYAGISTNSSIVAAAGLSYNIPLKVH